MKTTITALLVAAFLLLPYQSNPQPTNPPDNVAGWVLPCAWCVIIIGCGCLIVIGIKRMCDRTFSNHNWHLTNDWEATSFPPLLSGKDGPGLMRFQSSTGIGSSWIDEYLVDLQQNGNTVSAIVYRDNVMVASNSVPAITNGGPTILDFSYLRSTNCQPHQVMLMRIVE